MSTSFDKYWKERGYPWEFDPGPPPDLHWARIFSETPNYRGISKAILGSEKFRWHFGPMYYRGRLTPHSVKVLVIGQEGAQDESLAHRSFVGGTGAHMQHFLQFIGIDQSYLFVNTFVYPINGQYVSNLKWIAQCPDSPIVQHRHKILNYVLGINDVHLIIAVGAAAKDTITTWVESHGGTCPNGAVDVSTCTGNVLNAKTRIVGVLHPGGATKGGSVAAIKKSFQDATDKVRNWNADDPTWLPCDQGMTRDPGAPFIYGTAPIPFRDLPFGINWRLGSGATASNRKDSQRAIQAYSKGGKYGNKGATLTYSTPGTGTQEGYSEKSGDVGYEPPVAEYAEYDTGPEAGFAKLIMGGETGLEWPDFTTLGATSHISFGYGPVFRGRPETARVLVLADQQSQDDMFLGRAMCGEAGQRFQAFLEATGIRSAYCILRVLPVDTLDLTPVQRKSIAANSQIVKVYQATVNEVLGKHKTKFVLIVGSVAAALADQLVPFPVPVLKLRAWGEPGALGNWKNALSAIRDLQYPKEISNPSFAYDGGMLQIPRRDLPYGTLKWQGTSGDRGQRAMKGKKPSPDYYKWTMPQWASQLTPVPLTAEEQTAIQKQDRSLNKRENQTGSTQPAQRSTRKRKRGHD